MTRTRSYSLLSLLLALGAATLSGCASKGPSVTEWDGLILQPNTRLGAVFIKPGADLAAFTSVLLDPVQISFASDWNPRTCEQHDRSSNAGGHRESEERVGGVVP